jgi:hypothetical protein
MHKLLHAMTGLCCTQVLLTRVLTVGSCCFIPLSNCLLPLLLTKGHSKSQAITELEQGTRINTSFQSRVSHRAHMTKELNSSYRQQLILLAFLLGFSAVYFSQTTAQ